MNSQSYCLSFVNPWDYRHGPPCQGAGWTLKCSYSFMTPMELCFWMRSEHCQRPPDPCPRQAVPCNPKQGPKSVGTGCFGGHTSGAGTPLTMAQSLGLQAQLWLSFQRQAHGLLPGSQQIGVHCPSNQSCSPQDQGRAWPERRSQHPREGLGSHGRHCNQQPYS